MMCKPPVLRTKNINFSGCRVIIIVGKGGRTSRIFCKASRVLILAFVEPGQ